MESNSCQVRNDARLYTRGLSVLSWLWGLMHDGTASSSTVSGSTASGSLVCVFFHREGRVAGLCLFALSPFFPQPAKLLCRVSVRFGQGRVLPLCSLPEREGRLRGLRGEACPTLRVLRVRSRGR